MNGPYEYADSVPTSHEVFYPESEARPSFGSRAASVDGSSLLHGQHQLFKSQEPSKATTPSDHADYVHPSFGSVYEHSTTQAMHGASEPYATCYTLNSTEDRRLPRHLIHQERATIVRQATHPQKGPMQSGPMQACVTTEAPVTTATPPAQPSRTRSMIMQTCAPPSRHSSRPRVTVGPPPLTSQPTETTGPRMQRPPPAHHPRHHLGTWLSPSQPHRVRRAPHCPLQVLTVHAHDPAVPQEPGMTTSPTHPPSEMTWPSTCAQLNAAAGGQARPQAARPQNTQAPVGRGAQQTPPPLIQHFTVRQVR